MASGEPSFLIFAGFPIFLAVFRLPGYAISSEDDCAWAASVKPNTPNKATVSAIPASLDVSIENRTFLRRCNEENMEVSGAFVIVRSLHVSM